MPRFAGEEEEEEEEEELPSYGRPEAPHREKTELEKKTGDEKTDEEDEEGSSLSMFLLLSASLVPEDVLGSGALLLVTEVEYLNGNGLSREKKMVK